MKNLFLKAKHWQLFLVAIGLPMVAQFTMMFMMISSMIQTRNPDPFMMFDFMQYFIVIMVLFAGTLFGWFWSVVTGLQDKVPQGIKMSITRFKIFFFIPLIYILLILVYMQMIFSGIASGGAPDISIMLAVVGIIVPMHLFSIFCMFHTLYFTAKTIKIVELQREVSFSDFVGEFFLAWFFPIGVWILQPQINKMVADK